MIGLLLQRSIKSSRIKPRSWAISSKLSMRFISDARAIPTTAPLFVGCSSLKRTLSFAFVSDAGAVCCVCVVTAVSGVSVTVSIFSVFGSVVSVASVAGSVVASAAGSVTSSPEASADNRSFAAIKSCSTSLYRYTLRNCRLALL